MDVLKKKYLRSPHLEILIMVSAIILSYFGLMVLSLVPDAPPEGAMSTSTISWITFAFFLLSVAIAMMSVIAGIGGGVIFTPIMLAFTGVNSLVVRGTGLIVAMFSGLISTGIFIKKGLGRYRFCLLMTLSQSLGALLGATLAITTAEKAGKLGEGLLRTGLGVILALIAAYFFFGKEKLEWPVIKKIDRFTAMLHLNGAYYDEAEETVKEYQVTRAPLGLLLVFIVGVMGGFFGMGGGWAITPSLNLGMGMPLKLAAANSGIILGIGSCVSIWPYIFSGSIIPLFVLPWLAGQVIGGFIGSYALSKIKVQVVRIIMIGIMVFTAFGLLTKGMSILGLIAEVPAVFQVLVLTLILIFTIVSIVSFNKKKAQNSKWEAVSTEALPNDVKTNVLRLPTGENVYADIMHWVTLTVSITALFMPIFILANSAGNALNPNIIFGAIFNGSTPAEIWAMSATGRFPGAHFYLIHPRWADSWAMLTVNIGCASGLIAVVPAMLIQLFKEKQIFNGILSAMMAILILLSMTGSI